MSVSIDQTLDETLRRARRQRLWEPGPATRALDVDRAGLEALIPHRAPFLLLDGVTAIDLERRVIAGRRRIDPADPVLAGHFPGHPVYPGVLLVEAMAQLAACFRPLEVPGTRVQSFATACRAVFLRPVHPGDELTILGTCVGAWDGLYDRGVGQVLRGDEICAVAAVEGCHVG